MRIIIEYESSWRNSFLDGSNSEPLPKGGRNFIGSMTTLKQPGNFIQRSITKDTVMGVLNRLIGEQRKLYQARQDPDYYFADIEAELQEADIVDKPSITQEMVYIRNITGSTDQNSFTGMIRAGHPVFKSDYSSELWGVLWLDLESLTSFIMDDTSQINGLSKEYLDPITILNKSIELQDLKSIEQNDDLNKVVARLADCFPDELYVENNGLIRPIRFYAAALYMQIERLRAKFNMATAYNKRGQKICAFGFSKRGFNGSRDFMKNFITGREKIIWGNPYLHKEKKKGEGEVVSKLTKASGQLEINLNIPKERAKDLEIKIENAGVSAFYLGKKGLAYVKDIRI